MDYSNTRDNLLKDLSHVKKKLDYENLLTLLYNKKKKPSISGD